MILFLIIILWTLVEKVKACLGLFGNSPQLYTESMN
jgi:hypothetical protein